MKKHIAFYLPCTMAIAVLANAVPAHADARKWEVIPAESSITFKGRQMGTAFEGGFEKFTADIAFDATALDQSKVSADIDTGSAASKDKDVASNVRTKDWLNTDQFPTARFESTAFEKTGDDSFKASGNLTIRDVTVPVTLPFTLKTVRDAAGAEKTVMDGKAALDRSAFKLGGGEWADPSVVANEVEVTVHITAIPSP